MRTTIRQSTVAHTAAPVYSIVAPSIKISTPIKDSPIDREYTSSQYAYVLHDAKQTGLITLILLASSIALYFFVQNHILNLAFLGY